jgi:hypothetical protein
MLANCSNCHRCDRCVCRVQKEEEKSDEPERNMSTTVTKANVVQTLLNLESHQCLEDPRKVKLYAGAPNWET